MKQRLRKDGTPVVYKKRMGRPFHKIDQKQFEALCKISPTIGEVCSVFGIEDDTLNYFCKRTYGKTFSEVMPRYAASGNLSLRRKLWQMALEKDDMRAIEKLARKHLDMDDTQRPNLILGAPEKDSKQIVVQWVTDNADKDYFDK